MSKVVKVAMPQNISVNDSLFFDPYLTYELPKPKVRMIKNAFITSSGLVCGKKGLIKECLHHTWEYQFEVCLRMVSEFYHAAKDDSDKLIVLDDDETYLVIHHPWFKNYYHWMNEALLRLWMVKDKASSMILMLPDKEQMPGFAFESLKLFNFKNIIHLPIEKSALVRQLCMPELKPTMATYMPKALRGLNKFYIDKARTLTKVGIGTKLFVSRRNAKRRLIVNEEDVIETVLKFGFEVIYSEDYTFFEQISIFSNARYMMGLHGAGFSNMMFMQPGATIFELHKQRTNDSRHHNLVFWYMADGLGHKYYQQICQPINADEQFYTANVVVDIGNLNRNLETIFLNRPVSL